eukprot:Ihof_evm6s153 gene=Ihof_evmTU6s153
MLSLSTNVASHLARRISPQLGLVALRSYSTANELKYTPLANLHKALGAKMVPFCGWSMPLQYRDMGIIDSHRYTRKNSSLFDVSHMLQLKFHGKDRVNFIEKLVVGSIAELASGTGSLSLITNEKGGIRDDTMINNAGDHLYVVCNAGCAEKDLTHFEEHAAAYRAQGGDVNIEVLTNSLVALQGPKSAEVLRKLVDFDLSKFYFLNGVDATVGGVKGCRITRCGYTGEDGFEISIPQDRAVELTTILLGDPVVRPAGLGARDSLRLEAGLCLYGHDIDDDITPIEANLTWTIGKRRRTEGGFLGSDVILAQLAAKGGLRRRVGLIVDGAPARDHAEILDAAGNSIGKITSGVPSPCLGANVAMGYVDKAFAK